MKQLSFFILSIIFLLQAETFGKADATETKAAEIEVQGCVRDPNGRPLEGVQVKCFYLREYNGQEWPFEYKRQTTDKNGRYVFDVKANIKYEIRAGGIMSTSAASEKFTAEQGEVYQVKDIVVRPATSILSGVVLDVKGEPVKCLRFMVYSKSFSPFSFVEDPCTGSNGEFHIPHVLPDEPLSLSIITSENTAQFWKNLKPGSTNLKLIFDPKKNIKLPPDWRIYGDLRHLSLENTYIKDDVLDFNLPGLNGNLVSLRDKLYNRKVVLVNIFGSWCGGCLKEIPLLIKIKEKYADYGLEIIGVAFEKGKSVQQVETLKSFVNKKKINYTVLVGGSPEYENVESIIGNLKEFAGFPTTIFISRDGKVRDVQVGFVWETPERLAWQERKVEKLLKELLR